MSYVQKTIGENELIKELRLAEDKEDMLWALELSDYLISLDHFNSEVKT